MTDKDDISGLAGEYVLGTLDAPERADVDRRRATEPRLDAAIRDWQAKLAPLADSVRPIEPSSDLFARISAEIDASLPDDGTPGADIIELDDLRASRSRWQRLAIVTSAIAAALAVFIIIRPLPQAPETYVAVFQEDDKQPSFLLSLDLKSRQLVIRPVTADRPDDKSYQLWIVSDDLGGLKSLGLLEASAQPTRKDMPPLTIDALKKATFGISLEPRGGSPGDAPTGPAIHGKLIPANR